MLLLKWFWIDKEKQGGKIALGWGPTDYCVGVKFSSNRCELWELLEDTDKGCCAEQLRKSNNQNIYCKNIREFGVLWSHQCGLGRSCMSLQSK